MIDEKGILETLDISEVGAVDGLVAYYPLDGNARDCSGKRNHGTVSGVPLYEAGLDGKSLLFKLSGDKMTINDVAGDTITMAAWHRWDATSTTWRTVFGSTSNIHHMIFNNNRSINIWDGGQRSFGYYSPDNNWHYYVIIIRSGISADLYVDGIYISTVTTTLTLSTYPVRVIGNWGSNSYPAGYLCDTRIYNRALTAEEIHIMYKLKQPDMGMQVSETGKIYLSGRIKEV